MVTGDEAYAIHAPAAGGLSFGTARTTSSPTWRLWAGRRSNDGLPAIT
jgi:hypothetical protein